MDQRSNQLIKGYELQNELGAGGFGAVYRATQPLLGREVAVKIIQPRYANHPNFIRNFEAEAQLVARLEHPYIVPLYDYWRDPSGAYLVMRFVRGGSLLSYLREGPWALNDTVRLLDQIGGALTVAHRQGVIHRDVKPANILLDEDHNAYLADFGIAQALGNSDLEPLLTEEDKDGDGISDLTEDGAAGDTTASLRLIHTGHGVVVGSLAYMAPEQVRGEAASPQSDIYNLGLLLYELLVGARPFPGPTPKDLLDQQEHMDVPSLTTHRPELPAELDAVLRKATAKDPADRYEDVREMLVDFRRAASAGVLADDDLRKMPTGPTTGFLFSDIENSTQRWERYPNEMQVALGKHDVLMRKAVSARGGRIFQTAGDSFAVAFPTTQDAFQAAIDAQHLFQEQDWPPPVGAIRVRMGVGCGPAEVRDGGFHAEYTLNRLARMMSSGYGGQVLVSPVAQAELAGNLPPGVELRNMGERRLKDLSELYQIFQLVAPGLQAEFPPLKTLDAPSSVVIEENLPDPVNPYKGLRAFQEADAEDFFGRNALIHHLLGRLDEEGEFQRFLAVVGPSGSGKSSVVRAGLVPALRKGALAGLPNPFVVELIPGTHPLEEIEQALLRVAVEPPKDLLSILRGDTLGLLKAVNGILSPDDPSELVLVVDQFEEIFTLIDDEALRVHILDSLRAAVTTPGSRLRLVVTMRADFYDRPLLYPGLSEMMRQRTEVVIPLNAAEQEQAITGPAERVGVKFEPELLNAIMQDVGEQPGTLPLMQYALTELFDRRVGRRLTLAAYREGGGVLGALARRAEEIYEKDLNQTEREVTRQLFLRLVTLGEGVEDTRRRVGRGELVSLTGDQDVVDSVLNYFSRYRLLTFDRDPITREPTVEVAHEALIRTWTRLREWLDASRSDLRIQRQMLTAAGEWADSGKESSFLASGTRLDQFAGLRETAGTASGVALTPLEREYLDASLAAKHAAELAEQERQEHELRLARETAAAQKQAAGRLRILVGAMAVFLIVAIGLTIFAYNSQQEAVRQRERAQADFTRAEAQRLAAEANTLLAGTSSSEIIGLLSVRAIHTQYSSQGDVALTGAAALPYPHMLYQGHTDQVHGVAYTPDGKGVVTASFDKTAKLWDLATGKEIRTFSGHEKPVYAVAVSPDGKTLLTGSADATAKLWDLATGKLLQTLSGHADQIWTVAFAPDGKTVLTGGVDFTAKLWDVATGKELRSFKLASVISALAFAPDSKSALIIGGGTSDENGKTIISGNDVTRWDLTTGQPLPLFQGHTATVQAAAYSPDGKTLASGSFDHSIRLWDTATGKEIRQFSGHTQPIETVAFSADGKLLVSGGRDKTVRIWDVATGQEVERFIPNTGTVTSVAFAPDGQTVLSNGEGDNIARLWDVHPRTELPILNQGAEIRAVAVSPDGKWIATGGADTMARLWDAATGEQIRQFAGHTDTVSGLAFSPDGKTLLTGSFDLTARLWDVATGKEVHTLSGHKDWVDGVAFSPDGKTVVTGGDVGDKTARLWDVATGQEIRQFAGHDAAVSSVALSPDGKTLLTGSEDTTAKLWDVATGKELHTLSGHKDWIEGVAFAPDGKQVLTGSADKTAKLWDVATGQEVRTFVGHTANIWRVAFAPDGKTVLTASTDSTARLWDVATGAELRRFQGHTDLVRAVAYAPDGNTVVTGSADHTARQWHVSTDDTIHYLCSRLLRDFSDAERKQYGIGNEPTCAAP